jgi:signal transduction histidine kinase
VKPRRISLPQLGFAARVYIWVSFFALTFLTMAAAAWMESGREALMDTQRQMDDALKRFELLLDEQSTDLEVIGGWLTGQREFIDLLVRRDSPELASGLEPLIKANLADTLTVTDDGGKILARLSRDQPSSRGDSILDQSGVSEALSGRIARGVTKDRVGQLQQTIALPIYVSQGKPPIGVLILEDHLDADFIQRVTIGSEIGLSYFYADETTLCAFADWQQRERLTRQPLSPVLSAAQGKAGGFLKLETNKGQYLFKFVQFRSLGDNSVGAYGVGIPLAAMENQPTRWFGVLELTSLVLIATVLIGGYFFARRYASPLQALRNAARRMADGDLSVRIDLRHADMNGLDGEMDRMREQLRDSFESVTAEKNRILAILRSIGAAVVITDEGNHIVDLNPAAGLLLRQSEVDLRGQEWRDVFVESENRDEGNVLVSGSEKSGSSGVLDLALHRQRSLRKDPRGILNVISKQFQVDHHTIGYVHVLQDASEQEQFMRAKDEFIVNAAHELRGPLAALRASVEALIEEQSTVSKQELNFMLRNMQRAVVRFQGFAENLIDMGNVLAGRFMVRPVPSPLDDILDAATGQVAPLLEVREQSLEVKNLCSQGGSVFADPARIIQVLVNLLNNASKYGPEGGPIVLSISADQRMVIVRVIDRGPGIALDEQPHLFQRFYRGKRVALDGAGLGLGLALTKEIVEAHGGEIGIESQIGEGTTVWFSLLKA